MFNAVVVSSKQGGRDDRALLDLSQKFCPAELKTDVLVLAISHRKAHFVHRWMEVTFNKRFPVDWVIYSARPGMRRSVLSRRKAETTGETRFSHFRFRLTTMSHSWPRGV